jgi:hypothetical protein
MRRQNGYGINEMDMSLYRVKYRSSRYALNQTAAIKLIGGKFDSSFTIENISSSGFLATATKQHCFNEQSIVEVVFGQFKFLAKLVRAVGTNSIAFKISQMDMATELKWKQLISTLVEIKDEELN